MSVLTNLIYRFIAISINTSKLFCEHSQSDYMISMEIQETQNKQNNIEDEEGWRIDTIQIQDLL